MSRTFSFRTFLRRSVKIALFCVGGVLFAAFLFIAFLPSILPWLTIPEIHVDLSPYLTYDQEQMFKNHELRLKLAFTRDDEWDLVFRAEGQALDWPIELAGRANYSLPGLCANGRIRAHIPDSSWRAYVDFKADSETGWSAHAIVPETTITESDPVIAVLQDELNAACTNLTFSGTFALTADAGTTNGLPVMSWAAVSDVRDLSASWGPSDKRTVIRNACAAPRVSGLADHVDVAPTFVTIEAIESGDIALTNAYAAVLTGENGFLATTVKAKAYGGQATIHSLYLNPETFNTGFTMLVDEIDTEQVINSLAGFHCHATGKLHGRLELKRHNGRIQLGKAYLYNTPGDTGRLQMDQADLVLNAMAMGGTSAADCDNTRKCLGNMTYTAIALELIPEDEERSSHLLRLHLGGSASVGKTTVPVNMTLNTRGPLETLLNFSTQLTQGDPNE